MSLWRGSSALLRTTSSKVWASAAPRTSFSTAATASAPAAAQSAISLDKKEWSPEKKRTGLLAVKVGCLPVWDHYGYRHNCTVLQVEECQVTQVKTADRHGFNAIQLGWVCARRAT
jgi:large subunit ribosomal protein L3